MRALKTLFVCAALCGPAAVKAADLVGAPPESPRGAEAWNGFYVGAIAGYAWADTGYYNGIPANTATGFAFDADGASIGGLVGYTWQRDRFVFGIEGDLSWTDFEGDDGGRTPNIGPSTDRIEGDWRASIRGRFGYLSDDRTLLYATAGVAFLDTEYSRPDDGPPTPIPVDQTLTGWTLGGGVEHLIHDNWRLRAEYRFSRYSEEGFDFSNATDRTLREMDESTVLIGASYGFR